MCFEVVDETSDLVVLVSHDDDDDEEDARHRGRCCGGGGGGLDGGCGRSGASVVRHRRTSLCILSAE